MRFARKKTADISLPVAITVFPEDVYRPPGDAEEMVNAALAGLDRGETVTIPSLPDVADWKAYETARQKLFPNLSLSSPAERSEPFLVTTLNQRGVSQMFEEINYNRRRFCGTAAMAIAVTQLSGLGSADARVSRSKPVATARGETGHAHAVQPR